MTVVTGLRVFRLVALLFTIALIIATALVQQQVRSAFALAALVAGGLWVLSYLVTAFLTFRKPRG